MKFSRPAFLMSLAVGFFFLTSCSTLEVHTDWDTKIDFSKFKTYTWPNTVQPDTGNPIVDDDLVDARIRSAVDQVLSAKGYRRMDLSEGEPDFWVHYNVTVKDKTDVTSIPTPMYSVPYGGTAGGYAPAMVWGGSFQTVVMQYEVGTLLIDIANPRTKRLVWRGVGSDIIETAKTPEKATKKIDNVVEQILKTFPPLPTEKPEPRPSKNHL